MNKIETELFIRLIHLLSFMTGIAHGLAHNAKREKEFKRIFLRSRILIDKADKYLRKKGKP